MLGCLLLGKVYGTGGAFMDAGLAVGAVCPIDGVKVGGEKGMGEINRLSQGEAPLETVGHLYRTGLDAQTTARAQFGVRAPGAGTESHAEVPCLSLDLFHVG